LPAPLVKVSHPLPANNADPLESDAAFRHSGWRADRRRVAAALRDVGVPEERYLRFCHCGRNAWVMRAADGSGRHRIAADFCHDRWCQPCAATRSRLIWENLNRHIAGRVVRFITLTLRSTTESCKDCLDSLYGAYAKLRRTKLWKGCVTGAAAFCELKWKPDTTRWHVHLHILAEGAYLPQSELSKAWLKATGTSWIVDVRLPSQQSQAARYVTKYASKPLDRSVLLDHGRLCEAMTAIAGRKTCMTSGSWRGLNLRESHDDTEWVTLAPLSVIRHKAAAGDPEAEAIITSLRKDDLWDPRMHPPPDLPDPSLF
jgi:hypothetical protein